MSYTRDCKTDNEKPPKTSYSDEFLSLLEIMHLNGGVTDIKKRDEDGNTIYHRLVRELGFMFVPLRDFLLNQWHMIDSKNKEDLTCFAYLMINPSHERKKHSEELIKTALTFSQRKLTSCSSQEDVSLEDILNIYHLQHWCEVYLFILDNPDIRNSNGESFFDILAKEAPGKDELWIDIVKQVNELILRTGKTLIVHQNTLLALDFWIQKYEREDKCTLSVFLDWYKNNFIENPYVFRELLPIFIKNNANIYSYDSETGVLKFITILNEFDLMSDSHEKDLLDNLKFLLEAFSFDFNKTIDGKSVLQRLNLKSEDLISDCLMNAAITQAGIENNSELTRKILNLEQTFLEKYYVLIFEKIPEVAWDIWCSYLNPFKNDAAIVKKFGNLFSLDGRIALNRVEARKIEHLWFSSSLDCLPETILINAMTSFIENFQSEMLPNDINKLQEIKLILFKALRYFYLINNSNCYDHFLHSLLHDCLTKIALIDSSYPGHCVSLVFVEGRLLYRCNKGGCTFGDDVIEVYQIGNPAGITIELLEKLMKRSKRNDNKNVIHKELHSLLDLKLIRTITGKMQSSGNCPFASVKKAFQALFEHFFPDANDSTELKAIPCLEEKQDKQITLAKAIFKYVIRLFSQKPALQDLIAQHQNSQLMNFVLCRLLSTQFDLSKDKEWGELAMSALRQSPHFEYHKAEFLIAYWGFNETKRNQLLQFLHYFGIDILEEATDDHLIVKLFRAIITKNYKAIDDIIHSGIHPDSLTYQGWTPLHLAVRNDDLVLIRCFLAFEPKWLSVTNTWDKTPIFYVKSVEAAEIFNAQQAELMYCAENEADNTPLNAAIGSGNFELVKYLLNHGAKLTSNSMHIAARSGCVKLGELIFAVDSKSIDSLDYDHDTPLMRAAWFNNLDFVQFLINNEADLNAKDINGNTALHYAAQYGREEILKLLLQQPTIQSDIKNHQGRLFSDYLKKKPQSSINDFQFFQREELTQGTIATLAASTISSQYTGIKL